MANSSSNSNLKSKSKKRKTPNTSNSNVSANLEVKKTPEFEIGHAGDKFDLSYQRAVKNATADADKLLVALGNNSAADKYNLVGFAVPALIILFFSLSFILISRTDPYSDGDTLAKVKLSASTIADGSYTEYLSELYAENLPFESGFKKFGSYFGFCEYTDDENDDIGDLIEPEEPIEPEPEVTTEAVTTVTEATTTLPSTVYIISNDEETEDIPDTFRMYAADVLLIRAEPSNDGAILGYFSLNGKVDVIEIRDDGWAEIYYGGKKVYVEADLLSDTKIVVTTATEATEEVTEETEEVTEEITEEVTETTTVTEIQAATTESETEETTTAYMGYTGYTGTYPSDYYQQFTVTTTTTTPEVTTTAEPVTVPTTVSTTQTTTEPTTEITTTEPVTEPSTEPIVTEPSEIASESIEQ